MRVVATQTGASSGFQPVQTILRLDSDGNLIAGDSLEASSSSTATKSISAAIASAFLPTGWPQSVTEDYLSFQIWDTIQGLCSYVRGMLSTQAMLQGIGVGSATATPTSAVVQFFYRDAVGLLAGVLFAAIQGSSFDSYAKQWRLVADIANDIGLTAELAAPAFSSPTTFLLFACIGSICRAITGVAGGATRMALTQHFALQGNAADIAAKEGSQETAVTLFGMILGLGLTRVAARNITAAWSAFIALTVLHVYANMRAMRCLCITRLNSERLDIIIKKYRENKKVPSPMEVASVERLIPPFVERVVKGVYRRVVFQGNCALNRQQWEVVVAPDLASLKNAKTRKLVADSFSRDTDIRGNVGSKRGDTDSRNTRSIVVPDPENKTLYVFIVQGEGSEDGGNDSCRQLVQGYCKARSIALQLDNMIVGGKNGLESRNKVEELVQESTRAVVGGGWAKLLTEAGWCCDRPALSQGGTRLHWGDASTATKKEN